MKKILVTGGKLACLLFLFNTYALFAQTPGNEPGNESVPIDGGASILAAAGVAYGVKKYRDYRKGLEDQENEI